jgi:hypothetical protein
MYHVAISLPCEPSGKTFPIGWNCRLLAMENAKRLSLKSFSEKLKIQLSALFADENFKGVRIGSRQMGDQSQNNLQNAQ